MAGEIRKQKKNGGLILEQRYLTKTKRLELNRERCFGCGICATVCPKEAMTLSEASIEEGRLTNRPEVDIDPEKCVLCGTCVVFCPSNALEATTEGEKCISVVEYEVMPTLRKLIEVDSDRCDISCELKCQEICPVEAIHVETKMDRGVTRITNVGVDEELCFYCKQCEAACPFNLIEVTKPFEGEVEINVERCPEGCRVCVDACPSDALSLGDDEKPEIDQEFCILCSACEKVCPEDAIHVHRTSIACSDVRSGAWFAALEKLTSTDVLMRELGRKAGRRRNEIVRERYSSLLL